MRHSLLIRTILPTILLASLALSACGVADVGLGAATAAKMKADETKQAQETLDKVKTDLDAAGKAEQQRLQKADNER